jgi:hypothetical protein
MYDSSSDSDSDSDSPRIGSRRRRPPPVTLAKIYAASGNWQNPVIREWDGTQPENDTRLFVYAYISNTTYKSYVSYSTQRKKTIDSFSFQGRPYDVDYTSSMHAQHPWVRFFESYIHLPNPQLVELTNILKNFMSGNLSFINGRELRDRHRIYKFEPQRKLGITHAPVVPAHQTYWYKLDKGYNLDNETLTPPSKPDAVHTISHDEFMSNYTILSSFIPKNVDMHLMERETAGRNGNKRIKFSRSTRGGKGKSRSRLNKKNINITRTLRRSRKTGPQRRKHA